MIRSTVDRNVGPWAVYVTGPSPITTTIENSTLAKNNGSGLFVGSGGVTLQNATIAANGSAESPSNFRFGNFDTSLTVESTIIAGAKSGTDCEVFGGPTIFNEGFNLDSDTTCPFDGPRDLSGQDPLLGPLRDNGGSTPTMAIPKSSPATDQGDADQLTTDQRGKARSIDFANIENSLAGTGDGSDIGAYELQRR